LRIIACSWRFGANADEWVDDRAHFATSEYSRHRPMPGF